MENQPQSEDTQAKSEFINVPPELGIPVVESTKQPMEPVELTDEQVARMSVEEQARVAARSGLAEQIVQEAAAAAARRVAGDSTK